MTELTPEEQYIFEQTLKTGDMDIFTEYFFRLPWSGTWYTPEDRVEFYSFLYDYWKRIGQPDDVFTAVVDNKETTFKTSWDEPYYGDYPLFLLHHGFRMLPWLKQFMNPSVPLGIAITGTGTGKTCGVAIYALACCAIFPGFRFLNLAPSRMQAELMLGEVEKWCLNTKFRKFIVESKGANPLWVSRPHATMGIEVSPGYRSSFICQTVNRDATAVIGQERDLICCDESQLLQNIDGALPILATRLRGTRATGELRWGMLRWISNPGRNPELTALMEHYQKIEEESGQAIVLEEIHSSVNIYITKAQLDKQRLSLMSQRAEDRWHGGSTAAVYENAEIPEELLDLCRDDKLTRLTDKIGKHDDLLGLRSYEMKYTPGNSYVVCGDVGKSVATSLSSMNIPCVMVFDITDFLNEPIVLTAFYWFDGDGSYDKFIDTMKRAMLRYNAAGYYDATNVQTAFEDIRDAAFDGWPTTPVYFSGSVVPKRWSLTIINKLMSDKLFRWPYIKALWHQARVYDQRSQKIPDDIIATLMVFGLALRTEDTLWTQLEERYHWKMENDDEWGSWQDFPSKSKKLGYIQADRYSRSVSSRW